MSRSWWKQMAKAGARYGTDRRGAGWLLSPYFYLRCPGDAPATISREPWDHTIDWQRRRTERGVAKPTRPLTVTGHLRFNSQPERVLLHHPFGGLRRLYTLGDEAVLVSDEYAGLIDQAHPDATNVVRVTEGRHNNPLCWVTGRRVEAVLLPIWLERNLVVEMGKPTKRQVA